MLKKLFGWTRSGHSDSKTPETPAAPTSSMHILIDYENLLPQNLDKVPRNDNCHIWLFVGSRQPKLNAGLMKAMQEFPGRAHQIYLDAAHNQPNALDFILSYYLGYIAATYPQPHVAILSKDKGYEMVMDHARKNHNFLTLTRYDTNDFVENNTAASSPAAVPTVKPTPAAASKPSSQTPPPPIVVKPPTSPFGQAFREAIIHLTDQEKYHPRMRERLENLLAKEVILPIFSEHEEDFTEEKALKQAKKLVDQLRVSRLIEIEDKDVGLVTYHTDDESLYHRMKYFVSRKQPKHVVPLKEMVAYNYSHRDIEDHEIVALIERLKKDNILSIAKGGHISYDSEPPSMDLGSVNLDELVEKAVAFLKRDVGLPSKKASLFNVLGTHTNTKNCEEVLQAIVSRLEKMGMFSFNRDGTVNYHHRR